jgi:CRP/FNR family cyclic AMP-dependent transcriptional regulator
MRTTLYLFAAVTEGDIAWMAEAGAVRLFTPGEVLIRRGETLDALLILLEGDVRVAAGPGMPAPIRRAGECLGEVSLVDTRPASTDVAAISPVRALRLSGDTLRRQLDADNGFAARFWRGIAILLANRLREAATGDPDVLTLDETMLDGMARAGEKFLLLLDHTRDSGGSQTR